MKSLILSMSIVAFITGCSGGGGGSTTAQTTPTKTGTFIDSAVSGLDYSSKTTHGKTDRDGHFKYVSNEEVTFKVGKITLGTTKVDASGIVTPQTIVPNSDINDTRVVEILRVLQTLDHNKNPSDGIEITKDLTASSPVDLSKSHTPLTDAELASLVQDSVSNLTSASNAKKHFQDTLNQLSNSNNNSQSSDHSSSNDGDSSENHNSTSDGNTTTAGGTTGGTTDGGTGTGAYTLLAWNDLGMHCMDGSDFSVFSILPPYNNLNAQLIKKSGTSNKHITTGVTITYESEQSLSGLYNTTSMLDNSNNPKTNFWDYVGKLFNTTLVDDIGLTGNHTPSLIAHNLKYNSSNKWWEATGLPLTPYNDNGSKNYYPLVKVTAKDASGIVLATTTVVLPISDEMDCKACHSSTSGYTNAQPTAGWENDANAEKDFKYNILRLHDQKFPNAVLANQRALKAAGYNSYNDAGLYRSAKNGNPTLCATCHASNALPGTGIAGIKPLTEAIHSLHANVIDPVEKIKLGASANRSACYRCHPGATTKCLRGAMGKQSNIQCQSCHGNMNAVGKHGRVGWLEEPNCQACHQNGQRYTTAVTNTMIGTLRSSLDTRFATNTNTPANGVSLYRFSTGHGKMQCSACHGSTHAIYPSSHTEDNLQSIAVQGHSGTIGECTACHTTMPLTLNGGPHGMHTIGQSMIDGHYNDGSCTACHGSDYKGSALSKTMSARTFSVKGVTKSFPAGHQISCYDCHN